MSQQIAVVSLQPVMDTFLRMDTLSAEQVNPVVKEHTESSGGAVNMVRVLSCLRAESLVLGVCGEDNAKQYVKLLEQYGIRHELIPCKGETRQDITMLLPKDTVIQIARPGFAVPIVKLRELQQHLSDCLQNSPPEFLVFAGELPPAMECTELTAFIRNVCIGQGSQLRSKLVVNMPGVSVEELRRLRPYLAMIPLAALKQSARVNFRNETSILNCMRELLADMEHVVVSLSGKGFLYADAQNCCRIQLPMGKPFVSGQSDYFLAGVLCGLTRGMTFEETLRLGGSCAAWRSNPQNVDKRFGESALTEGAFLFEHMN